MVPKGKGRSPKVRTIIDNLDLPERKLPYVKHVQDDLSSRLKNADMVLSVNSSMIFASI